MGADLILSALPACSLDDDRRNTLREIAKTITLDDCDEYIDYLFEEEGTHQQILLEAIDAYPDLENRRDVCYFNTEDHKYPLLITGGMSWGEPPSECIDVFNLLYGVEKLYSRLREWAIADATKQPQPN